MSVVKDVFNGLTGKTAAQGAQNAAATQSAALDRQIEFQREAMELARQQSEQAQSFLAPISDIGQAGFDRSSFLVDPQEQFQYLQGNPLFSLALENANTQTGQIAAAWGRLSAGDTLQQLSQNVLLSASPLIGQQSQNIMGLMNLGAGVRGSQANVAQGLGTNLAGLTQGIGQIAGQQGDVMAAGQVGAANARTSAMQNLLMAGIMAGGLGAFGGGGAAAGAGNPALAGATSLTPGPFSTLSDEKLKTNIKRIGTQNGFNIYSWTWNSIAERLGLSGESFGVLAQEVREVMPDAVVSDGGYLKVNYDMIGVAHG